MSDLIQVIVGLGGLTATIILLQKGKSSVAKGQTSQAPLSKNEKVATWILCVINPVIAGAILYFGWKGRLPIKAKEANKISWTAFAIVFLGAIAFWILFGGEG